MTTIDAALLQWQLLDWHDVSGDLDEGVFWEDLQPACCRDVCRRLA